jgi:hypothetical protein
VTPSADQDWTTLLEFGGEPPVPIRDPQSLREGSLVFTDVWALDELLGPAALVILGHWDNRHPVKLGPGRLLAVAPHDSGSPIDLAQVAMRNG